MRIPGALLCLCSQQPQRRDVAGLRVQVDAHAVRYVKLIYASSGFPVSGAGAAAASACRRAYTHASRSAAMTQDTAISASPTAGRGVLIESYSRDLYSECRPGQQPGIGARALGQTYGGQLLTFAYSGHIALAGQPCTASDANCLADLRNNQPRRRQLCCTRSASRRRRICPSRKQRTSTSHRCRRLHRRRQGSIRTCRRPRPRSARRRLSQRR